MNGGNKKKNLCSKIDLQEDSKLSSSSWTGGKLFKILVGNVSTPVIGQGRVNEEVWLQSDEVKETNIIPIFTNHVTPLSCHVTSDEPIAEQKTTRKPHNNQAGRIRDCGKADKTLDSPLVISEEA